MPKKDTLDAQQMAAQYGWALSVLKSDRSLWRLFKQATSGPTAPWDQYRFVAELRSTRWFKVHSEAARNATVLRKTDPATWKQKTAETSAAVRDMATGMGAQLSKRALTHITHNVLTYGWNDNQIRDTLAGSVRLTGAGNFSGQASATAETLRESAQNNGVRVSDSSLGTWVRRIAAGEPVEGFETYVRDMAAGAFPSWAEQLKAGQDVKDLASPYLEQMAQTLELNPASVDLFDPTIRKALQTQDKDGKPAVAPLWSFEQSLKKDQRWLGTKGARNELDSAARGVLQDMGLGF